MRRFSIGALRHRVRIEVPVEMPAAGGALEITWQEVATVWASVAAVSGGEPAVADGLEGRARFDVAMRYREGVDASVRLVVDGRVLEVISAVDPDGRRRWLVCRAEERGP